MRSSSILIVGCLLPLIPSSRAHDHPYGECEECVCIPNEGEACPNDELLAAVNVSTRVLDIYRSMEHANPLSLDCNPYNDTECTTTPPQAEGAVCAINYIFDSDTSESRSLSCPTSYLLVTVDSKEQAEALRLDVTHTGACGVCSSTQDLVAYTEFPDLRDTSSKCGLQAIFNGIETGIECFKNEVQLSEACAKLWVFNVFNSNLFCGDICLPLITNATPSLSPPPECTLNACLQCDEDRSGPVFSKISGRTARSSGLLSSIARPCDLFPKDLNQALKDPCATGAPSSATFMLSHLLLFGISFVFGLFAMI